MTTSDEIKEMLEAIHVGKDYDMYHNESIIREFFNKLIMEAGFSNQYPFCFSVLTEKQTVSLYYAGVYFGHVTAHKKKGQSHYNFFGSYCDWTYSSFDVAINDATLEEAIQSAIKSAKIAKARENDKFNEAIEFINKHFADGETSLTNIFEMCKYINNNRYTLRQAFEK